MNRMHIILSMVPRFIVALIVGALVILALQLLTGCVSTAPRAGGDAASRSNGNIAITVNQHGPARDGTAEFNGKPVTGAVNIIIASNQTSQDAAKAVDALKAAANVAATGQGTAKAEGTPTVAAAPIQTGSTPAAVAVIPAVEAVTPDKAPPADTTTEPEPVAAPPPVAPDAHVETATP